MSESQKGIHKLDLSGTAQSPELFLDMLLSDLQEQLTFIASIEELETRNARIAMTREYVRGVRDGNRFMKKNPIS